MLLTTTAMDVTPLTGVKGSVVRSLVWALGEHGLLREVAARVSPAARLLIDHPPLPTEWIDVRHSNEIYEATLQIAGAERLRRINREAIAHGLAPLLRATIDRVLAIFGVSPATLLARMDRAAGATSRGIVYRYFPIEETAGIFEMEIPALTKVPLGVFVATAGGLEFVFELCRVRGTFGEPEMVLNGRENAMRYTVSWKTVTRK